MVKKLNLFIKRCVDIFGSGLGLLFLSPILLLTTLAIIIFMPGPVFFKQERVGKKGKPFKILKYRTMKVDKQAEQAHDFSKDQERLTKLGKVLRRTKIDELPQLINVFKGDMSLVGPRPTVLEQVEQYTERQRRRLDMCPGMTGMAQVNGNIELEWDERIEYDLEYIDKFSILLDLKILLKTVGVVLFGEEKFVRRKESRE